MVEGALAITGPAFRYTPEKVEAMRLPLLRVALDLSRKLGGQTAGLEAAIHRARAPANT